MFGFIQIPMSAKWLQYGRDGAFCDKRVKSRKNNMKISMCTHKLQVDVTLNTFVALFFCSFDSLWGSPTLPEAQPHSRLLFAFLFQYIFAIPLLCIQCVFVWKIFIFSILVLTVAFFGGRYYEHIFTHRF